MAPKAAHKVLRNIFSKVEEDKRGERELPSGNDRPTMRSLTNRLGKKMKKKSSLTSLRKDNEVKLEDEIN